MSAMLMMTTAVSNAVSANTLRQYQYKSGDHQQSGYDLRRRIADCGHKRAEGGIAEHPVWRRIEHCGLLRPGSATDEPIRQRKVILFVLRQDTLRRDQEEQYNDQNGGPGDFMQAGASRELP
jgi:hypothetical protein